jgi:hypothetical protein
VALSFVVREIHVETMLNVFFDHISWREMLLKKSLLVYWVSKCRNATIILAKLEGYFGTSNSSYPWFTKWLRKLWRGDDIFKLNESSGRPKDHLTGLKVADFLKSGQFASICWLSTASKKPRSTVFDHLMGGAIQSDGVRTRVLQKAALQGDVSETSRFDVFPNR